MDEVLPRAILDASQILTILVGVLVMVVIVNNWMILPIIVMSGIFYVVRTYYLKTAQNISRLAGVSKYQ